MKKKGYIILSVICVVVLIATGIILGVVMKKQSNKKTYTASIKTAEKYLEAGDYTQAVVAYKTAIEKMPEKETGYVGLANTYLEQGDTSSAKIILKKGYLVTNSSKIQYMLNGIEDGSLLVNNLKETPKKETLQKSGELSFNQNFFQKLESFTYQDYEREYGGFPEIVKVKNGEVEVVHKNLSATCFYANTSEHGDVVDTKTDTPDKTGMPEKIVVDDISLLFKNFTGELTIDELQSICGSKVDIVNKKERSYVEFESGSALIRIESDENGTISSSTAWNEIILTNANKNRTSKKSVFSGIVLNAMTSEGVESANINLEAQGDSSHSASVQTESDGSFSTELEADTYNITISAENYEEETFEFTIEENSNYSGEQFTISPSLASGSARIVLEWGDYPEDLDSYLMGTTDDGTTVDISFHNEQCTKDGEVIAELDVDERDGHGPETITLNDLNGTYRYLVDDFTESGKLQEYGATVKVYISGKSQPEVITIAPDAGVKNVWEVFELDHGKLNILNRAAVEDYE